MYATIRRYHTKAADADEIIRRVNEGFVPIISQAPGFIAYYALVTEDGVAASISLFATQKQSEEATQLAAQWVKENIAGLLPNLPETTAGEVRVQKGG